MACLYKDGDEGGVMQSNTRALEMYIGAAELGHAEALAHIGYRYAHGIGVTEDKTKATEYYEVAAKKGSAYAHRTLARFCGLDGSMKLNIEKVWTVHIDDKTGKTFYHNKEQKKSMWEKPTTTMVEVAESFQKFTKHLKVAASAGDKEAVGGLMEAYKNKLLSKEDLAQTLQAFQVSSNAVKSKDRDDERAYQHQA